MRRIFIGPVTFLACAALAGCGGADGGDEAAGGNGGTGGGSAGAAGAGGGGAGAGGSGWPDGGAGNAGAAGTGGGPGGAGGATDGGPAGAGGGGNGGNGGSGGAGGGAAGTGGSGGAGGGYPNPVCLGKAAGAYCGNDQMQGADPNVVYQCPGPNKPPTGSTPCPNGCVVEAPGVPDHCKTTPSPNGYRLPWKPGVTMKLTQDCNDSCCNDHVNDDGWAWDWANGTNFGIVAARGGTVTHLKINSTTGCGSSSCANSANLIVIDHGDGTASTYLHLLGQSLEPGVTCGATVQRGQALAKAGTTGWSTGLHLHFQVGKVHPGAPTCECGSDGKGCASGTVPWANFWSTPTYPTVSIQFEEWPAAPQCADRRITMPASQNQ